MLTAREMKEQYPVTDSELKKYFKNHRMKDYTSSRWKKLPQSKVYIRRARRTLRAAKISRAPGREYSFAQTVADWQIIYGTARVPGVFSFVSTSANHQNLNLVLTLAGHQIDSVTKLFLDDNEVVFGASPDPRWNTGLKQPDGTVVTQIGGHAVDHKIFMAVNDGNPANGAIGDLIAQVPTKWTANHKQSGRAHVYLILIWDALLWPDGLPEISFEVKGKKCRNPANGLAAEWSENPALCAFDYLTSPEYGMNIADTSMDMPSWQAAVADCTTLGYTINGIFGTADSPQDILESMMATMDGTLTYVGGLWKIFPAKWRTPVLDLTEEDFLSDFRIQTKVSRRDNFNAVRGTFVSPAKGYDADDFPVYKNDYYRQEDNGELVWEDIQLPLTIYPEGAQRLAKLMLEKVRQGITVEVTASMKAFRVEVPDNVTLTIERFGWSAKTFEVQESTLVIDDSDGGPRFAVRLFLKETASGVFDWANGEQTSYDLAPNTDLPSAFSVETPSGVVVSSGTNELYKRSDGTIFTRMKVEWTALLDFFVSSGGTIHVEYQKMDSATWTPVGDYRPATPVSGEFTYTHILDVEDGQYYNVRVRARSASGVYSSYAYADVHKVVGKTEKPSNVIGLAGQVGNFGVLLTWNAVPDLDVAGYQIRIGTINSDWDSAQLVDEISATGYKLDLKKSGEYMVFVKAKDTSLNLSTTAATIRVLIAGPAAPLLSASIIGQNVLLKWTESVSEYAISQYQIRYASPTEDNPIPSFANSVVLAEIKGNSYSMAVSWAGPRYFWVLAIDVAGNVGSPGENIVTIEPPGKVLGLTGEVIDNNVLLYWRSSHVGTLPDAKYIVTRGATFASSTARGEVGGTFATIFEQTAGDYTYWIIAIDTAGNRSEPQSIILKVSEPPDFKLTADGLIDPLQADLGENVFIEGFGFLGGSAGAGGPGGVGSPIGMFLTITQAPAPGGVGSDTGSPMGLLLAITKPEYYSGVGTPYGALLTITKPS